MKLLATGVTFTEPSATAIDPAPTDIPKTRTRKPKLEKPPQGPAGAATAPQAPAGRRAAARPPSRASAAPARPEWPADKVERWSLAKLIPYARNARMHSPAQVAQIAGSIREWGWTMPVLVDEDGTLIAGHGRVLAAHQLGLADAPTMVARGWTEAQKRAYRLADNRLPLSAEWDNSMLALELEDLRGGGIDLASLGFEAADLDAIFGTGESGPHRAGNLAEKFGIPPFSVLSARGGWWQGRKDAWIALGIQSELGRGDLASDRSVSTSARINDAAEGRRRYATPGGSLMPAMARDPKTGRLVRGDGRGRPIAREKAAGTA